MARKPAKFQLNTEQQKLAADNLNLARREAWRIQRSTGIDYHTLESVAFEGLCKAAYRYDASRPHPVTGKSMKFSSLAIPTIRGELLHWVRDRTYSMRLSHKMRERWVKGRKLLYRGATDIEIAANLGILLEEWQEVRKVCSGPPLELKDQATPTEPLEPSEVDFASMYLEQASNAMNELQGDLQDYLGQIELYLNGNGSRVPKAAVDALLSTAGCATTDWSQMDVNLLDGWEDVGDGRLQGSLF
jgi:DNA-directed RNA polymerase specialized sigma subunit